MCRPVFLKKIGWKEDLTLQFRYWLYYGFCCVGLIGVLRTHIRYIYALFFKETTAQLHDFVARWADKPIELFFFFSGAVLLLLYSFLVHTAWNRLKDNQSVLLVWRREAWGPVDMAWLLLVGFLNFTIGFDCWRAWFGEQGKMVGELLWILLIVLPILITWAIDAQRKAFAAQLPRNMSTARKIYALFIVVAILQVVSLVWPFVAKPLQMMNEYLELPTKTLVNGKYVDNAAYFNEHTLLGIQPRYQREQDVDNPFRPNPEACLSIGRNPGVEDLLKKTRTRAKRLDPQLSAYL